MPFELKLPPTLSQGQWKVKIRDKETREPPHVTVIRRTQAWRINLRTGEFMDAEPDPTDVPGELVDHIVKEENWKLLRAEWDTRYPSNPVTGIDEE